VTYSQLDRVLRALGFTCRVVTTADPPTRVYEPKDTGAGILLPCRPENDLVLDFHLAEARTTLDGFGIADAALFDTELHKAG